MRKRRGLAPVRQVRCSTWTTRKGRAGATVHLDLGHVAEILDDSPGALDALLLALSDQLGAEIKAHKLSRARAVGSATDPNVPCSHPDRAVVLVSGVAECQACGRKLEGASA